VAVAESARELIAQETLSYKGSEIAVTVSVGVATLRHPPQFPDAAALLAAADTALYEAKKAGRNRVESAPE
jgi:diguanylate cyclase (GGDEF)-like protein